MDRFNIRLSQQIIEQLVWFVLFLSWIPFLYGQNIFLIGQNPFPILLPEHALTIPIPSFSYFPPSAFGLMTIIGIATIFFVIILRDKRLIVPLLFILSTNFIFIFNGTAFEDTNVVKSLIYWIVLILFISSILVFLIHGHILSASFVIFSCLLMLDAAVFGSIEWWTSVSEGTRELMEQDGVPVPEVIGDPFSILSWLYGAYRPSFGLALIIILTLVLIRAFFLTWQDNRSLFDVIDTKVLIESAIDTVKKLWWPMPLVLIVMSFFWFVVFGVYVERRVICVLDERQVTGGRCNPSGGVTLETALDSFTQSRINLAQNEMTSGITESKQRILETTGKAPNATANAVDRATRGRLPGTNTERCGFLDVFCYIKNGVKSAANRAYQKARSAAVTQIRNDLNELDQAAIEKAGGLENATIAAVDRSANNIALYTESGIRSGFSTFRVISFLLALYSVLILIKTFLIVFARVLFDPDRKKPIYAQFMPGEIGRGQGNIIVRGSKLIVPKRNNVDRYYSYRGMQIAGPKKDRSFPLGIRFFLSRFLCGRITFLRVPNGSCDPSVRQSVTINLNVPAQLVEWELKKGERVFLRFADLQGFSGDVTFHRRPSMSISTLIFGRVILYYAEGPGTILLRTAAAAEISSSQTAAKPSEPETLVAWAMPLKYYVDAKLDWLNTFISSINLKIQSPGHFVRDTDDSRVSSTGGILRFITHFLLPI